MNMTQTVPHCAVFGCNSELAQQREATTHNQTMTARSSCRFCANCHTMTTAGCGNYLADHVLHRCQGGLILWRQGTADFPPSCSVGASFNKLLNPCICGIAPCPSAFCQYPCTHHQQATVVNLDILCSLCYSNRWNYAIHLFLLG